MITTAPERSGSRRPPGEAGFILIPVLFTLALLSLVALTLTRTVTTDIRANAQLLRLTEAEALADGIANLVVQNLQLTKSQVGKRGPLRVDGTPLSCRIANSAATISVRDTAGQIDLNQASQDLLERLFAGLGVPGGEAARLAAAIIDFRDADDITLVGGAELAEYRAAGLAHGPKNAPFGSVGELDQVLGMTPELMALVRPLVTVNSRLQGIDMSVASPEIRALSLPSALIATTDQRAYLVRVGVHHAGNSRFVRELVMELTPRAPAGYLIKDWSRGETGADVAQYGAWNELPPCLEVVLSTDP